jgi:hypothetical protein
VVNVIHEEGGRFRFLFWRFFSARLFFGEVVYFIVMGGRKGGGRKVRKKRRMMVLGEEEVNVLRLAPKDQYGGASRE